MYQPQYGMPYQQPFQQSRRLTFVHGEEGMRAYPLNPGDVMALFDEGGSTMWLKSVNQVGVPSSVRYRLTEESEDVADAGTEARLAAIERSLGEIREALGNDTVPEVRQQPRHVASAGDGAGA